MSELSDEWLDAIVGSAEARAVLAYRDRVTSALRTAAENVRNDYPAPAGICCEDCCAKGMEAAADLIYDMT